MCGIVGRVNFNAAEPIDQASIRRMLNAIRHRGPDDSGVFVDSQVGLGSARLSIIDLPGGHQPISNEDGTVWVVFNGEIYNHLELRAQLESAGHIFRTRSDTEVLVHLYEQNEADWLMRLNGQFAIALWDQKKQSLILARDRMGVRPIYYTTRTDFLLFASEAKALFTHPGIDPELDPVSVAQVFTFWSTLSPRSSFRNIFSIPPGHFLTVHHNEVKVHSYWHLKVKACDTTPDSLDQAADELRWLLNDAVRLRLRSDVPVGAYLSGGLDSSSITALTYQHTATRLKTFSIAFQESSFDESHYQRGMNEFLNVDNETIHCSPREIGESFSQAVFHAEMPLLRTALVPMFLLSKLVHQHGYKVVLTGEGADEILGGYDIFKESKIRRFWARQPDSHLRPLLLRRLYPHIQAVSSGGDAYLRAFFGKGLDNIEDPFYSHRLRWENTRRCWRFFSSEMKASLVDYDPIVEFAETLPAEFNSWDPFVQSQYLEIAIFLPEYLLSSQGDRMGMANSVEGRYPFLDPRVVDYSINLPAVFKLYGLQEKAVLKRAMKDMLPPQTLKRVKQPYRAPIRSVFFGENKPDYVEECLSPRQLKDTGYFDPEALRGLCTKFKGGGRVSEMEEMALTGILSVQLLHSMWRS
ncbi:asparagine synthase (glutamine-hydrolyzing) [Chloroflexota bacterium]